ncbi:MAG: response regulator transcription factor [Candidatus Margulisiibacteriota bacterium]
MNKKVLIIEDHPETAKLISELLQFEGIETITASNGHEGIEKANAQKPDLILLDVMMPGIDGFEVCQKLKTNPETSHIPVIIVSIRAATESQKQGKQAGADEYLTKPFEPFKLIEVLKKYLKS